MFCQEDRAILCKDCDVAIHWANQVTRNHQRFLLTGVKLSSAAFSLSSLPNSNSHHVGANVSSTPVSDSPSVAESSTATASAAHGYGSMNGMAEYLIEPLPEWHFEEFIDSSSTPTTAPHHHHLAFSKVCPLCIYLTILFFSTKTYNHLNVSLFNLISYSPFLTQTRN